MIDGLCFQCDTNVFVLHTCILTLAQS